MSVFLRNVMNFTGCERHVMYYESLDECVKDTIVGACCYRSLKNEEKSSVAKEQYLDKYCKVLYIQ